MKNFIIVVIACLLLSGCPGNTRPQLPEKVYITVTKYKDLPSWATEQVKKPMPTDGTVAQRVISHDARGNVIDYLNCRSLLLDKMDRGEDVKIEDCNDKL